MQIEKSKRVLALVGLGALLGTCPLTRAGDAQQTVHPSLAGRWELVPDQSDDPGKATDVLLAPPHLSGEGGRPPFGGGPPMVGGGGLGGFPGGHGGGGRGGWGRGRWGGGESSPPTEEERAGMRDAVRSAIEGGASVQIVDTGSEVEFQFPEGRTRRVATNGRAVTTGRVVQRAAWKKDHLELKTETRRLKIKETWSLVDNGAALSVEVRARKQDYSGEVVLKRLYRRVAEDALPVTEAPLVPGT